MKRDVKRWRKNIEEFDGVAHFCESSLPNNAVSTIKYGKTYIDIMTEIKPGRPLVIFFCGAATKRESVSLPIFAGLGVLEECDASKVFISDPTLHLSDTITIAWYAGYKGASLQDDLVRIIESIIKKSEAKKTLMTGGSGGGFAAMYYSSRIKNSLAVPWNPQTSILRYHKRFVDEYVKTAWGLTSIPDDESKAPQGLEAGLFKRYSAPPNNYVIYLQNNTDDHVQVHLTPLMAALGVYEVETGFVNENFYLKLGKYGDGHAPPGRDYLNDLYKALLNSQASWQDMFGSNELSELLRV